MCFIDYNFFPILFFLGWNIFTAKQFMPTVSQTPSIASRQLNLWKETQTNFTILNPSQVSSDSKDLVKGLARNKHGISYPDTLKFTKYQYNQNTQASPVVSGSAFTPWRKNKAMRWNPANLSSPPFLSPPMGGKAKQWSEPQHNFAYTEPSIISIPPYFSFFFMFSQSNSFLAPSFSKLRIFCPWNTFYPIGSNVNNMLKIRPSSRMRFQNSSGSHPSVKCTLSFPNEGKTEPEKKGPENNNIFKDNWWNEKFKSDMLNRTYRPKGSVIFSSRHKQNLTFSSNSTSHFTPNEVHFTALSYKPELAIKGVRLPVTMVDGQRLPSQKYCKRWNPNYKTKSFSSILGNKKVNMSHRFKTNNNIYLWKALNDNKALSALSKKNSTQISVSFHTNIFSPWFLKKKICNMGKILFPIYNFYNDSQYSSKKKFIFLGPFSFFSIKKGERNSSTQILNTMSGIKKRRSKIRLLLRTPINKIYSLNKFQIPLCFSSAI